MDLSQRYKEKVNFVYNTYKEKHDKTATEYLKQRRELNKKEKFDREILLSQFYSEMIAGGETAVFRCELQEDDGGGFGLGYLKLTWRLYPVDDNASTIYSILAAPFFQLPSYEKMRHEMESIRNETDVDMVAYEGLQVNFKVTTDGRDVQWEKM